MKTRFDRGQNIAIVAPFSGRAAVWEPDSKLANISTASTLL